MLRNNDAERHLVALAHNTTIAYNYDNSTSTEFQKIINIIEKYGNISTLCLSVILSFGALVCLTSLYCYTPPIPLPPVDRRIK